MGVTLATRRIRGWLGPVSTDVPPSTDQAGTSPALEDPLARVLLVLAGYGAEELPDRLSRPGVIDRLLDLRNAAAELPRLRKAVDEVLARVPGRDVVRRDWWVTEVGSLTAVIEHIGGGTGSRS